MFFFVGKHFSAVGKNALICLRHTIKDAKVFFLPGDTLFEMSRFPSFSKICKKKLTTKCRYIGFIFVDFRVTLATGEKKRLILFTNTVPVYREFIGF